MKLQQAIHVVNFCWIGEFRWIPALLCILVISTSEFAHGDETAFREHVAALASPSFQERTAAQRALSDLNVEQINSLADLALEADAERAARIVEILEGYFLRFNDELGEVAEKGLMKIAASGGEASVAAGLTLQGNSRLRESRARLAIEKLGGEFVYYDPVHTPSGALRFRFRLSTLPEIGVGFGPRATLASIYLHEDWKGTEEDLWHLSRLTHIPDLMIYNIKGNGIDLADLFAYGSVLKGLSIGERGACLGIQSQSGGFGVGGDCQISDVVKGGAAENAGLLVNDNIVALDGEPIRNFPHLVQSLQGRNIGEKVTLTVERNLEEIEKDVVLGSWRSISKQADGATDSPPAFKGPYGILESNEGEAGSEGDHAGERVDEPLSQ